MRFGLLGLSDFRKLVFWTVDISDIYLEICTFILFQGIILENFSKDQIFLENTLFEKLVSFGHFHQKMILLDLKVTPFFWLVTPAHSHPAAIDKND